MPPLYILPEPPLPPEHLVPVPPQPHHGLVSVAPLSLPLGLGQLPLPHVLIAGKVILTLQLLPRHMMLLSLYPRRWWHPLQVSLGQRLHRRRSRHHPGGLGGKGLLHLVHWARHERHPLLLDNVDVAAVILDQVQEGEGLRHSLGVTKHLERCRRKLGLGLRHWDRRGGDHPVGPLKGSERLLLPLSEQPHVGPLLLAHSDDLVHLLHDHVPHPGPV